ncbi:hypothetical protein ACQCWA_05075 [Rossellomorea aquimaris]
MGGAVKLGYMVKSGFGIHNLAQQKRKVAQDCSKVAQQKRKVAQVCPKSGTTLT